MARKNWSFFHFKIINDTWSLPHGKYANKDIKRAIIREFTVFTVHVHVSCDRLHALIFDCFEKKSQAKH